jgi:hypothetical protein
MELTPYQSTLPMAGNCASEYGCATLEASITQVAAACREQRLEMELVTAEGDRVTLSLESRSRALAVGYAELQAGSGSISLNQGGLFAGEQERSMNLTVEGDLNEQEKKDLRSVFKALKNMMGHFCERSPRAYDDQSKAVGQPGNSRRFGG